MIGTGDLCAPGWWRVLLDQGLDLLRRDRLAGSCLGYIWVSVTRSRLSGGAGPRPRHTTQITDLHDLPDTSRGDGYSLKPSRCASDMPTVEETEAAEPVLHRVGATGTVIRAEDSGDIAP